MKKILKIFILLFISVFSFFSFQSSFAENIKWLNSINWAERITQKSDVWDTVKDIGFKILNIIRIAFSGIFVIFIVYAWWEMIISRWTNEETLSNAKRTIRYSLIWVLFINFPFVIYNAIVENKVWSENFLIVESRFVKIISQVTVFLEVLVAWVAVFMLVLTWINIILSRWRSEKLTEAKNKILWIVVALIFVWFIEAWERFILWWKWGNFNIDEWVWIFQTLINLILYFVWPVALFFLVLAWYYYITSAWDEERAKKWKSIVVNIIIWTIIILCSYVLLNDINSLTI